MAEELKIHGYRKDRHKAILNMIPDSFDGFSGFVFDGNGDYYISNDNSEKVFNWTDEKLDLEAVKD